MLGRLFSRKEASPTTLVVARLNDRAMPMDRGDLYEDPLNDVLSERGWGEVTGGGSQLSQSGEIAFCDVEIRLTVATPEVLNGIIATLESLGAPRGSKLLREDAPEQAFGQTEGIAVYLNGTELPAATYQECDVNFVHDEFNRLLDGHGKVHSHWQGATETALYSYGASAEQMQRALADFLSSYPLCERARIVQIA